MRRKDFIEKDSQQFLPTEFDIRFTEASAAISSLQSNIIGSHTEDWADRFLRRHLAFLYRKLDSRSGRKSWMLTAEQDTYYHALKLIDELINLGYIESSRYRFQRFNDAPPFAQYGIQHIFQSKQTDGELYGPSLANGFSPIPSAALSQALGEYLERYFLAIYKNSNFVEASAEQIKRSKRMFLDPELLTKYSKSQRSKNHQFAFDQTSVFRWGVAKELTSNKPVLIPAQLFHWNYQFSLAEPVLQERNTNGAGCMNSLSGAILVGLFELIERDGYLIFWQNKISPPKINPETIKDAEFQQQLAIAKKYKFELSILDFTTDIGVPSFGVLLEDNTNTFPARSLGLSAHVDPTKAIKKALYESWGLYYWIRNKGKENYIDRLNNINHITRVQMFGMPENKELYAFLTRGEMVSLKERKYLTLDTQTDIQLKQLTRHLCSFGETYNVYYYQAKSDFLQKHGFYCVQVIVPALVPIHLNESNRHLGSARLKTVPVKIGYQEAEVWNQVPQPFP